MKPSYFSKMNHNRKSTIKQQVKTQWIYHQEQDNYIYWLLDLKTIISKIKHILNNKQLSNPRFNIK